MATIAAAARERYEPSSGLNNGILPIVTASATIFPADRYGRRRREGRRRRWLPVFLVVAVIAIGVGIAGKLYFQYGKSSYGAEVVSYQISNRSVTVRLNVTKPAGKPATCGITASRQDGSPVGTGLIRVPAGDPHASRVSVAYTLPTTGRAYAVEVPTCAAPASGG